MYTSVYDIELKNRQAGYYWFEADTKRFFHSRTGNIVYAGKYFISSEKPLCYESRRYSIRYADDNGDIHTVGKFRQYATWNQAYSALQAHIKAESNN